MSDGGDWDVVVVGGGPAGMRAATLAAASGLSCVCIERLAPGGLLLNLGTVEGDAQGRAGPDLAAEMMQAAMEAGVEFAFDEATAVEAGEPRVVRTAGALYRARCVVLATGLSAGRLGIGGEDAYRGRGLSDCAHCDGPLYRDQPVLVVGDGRWAVQEALDLAAIASHVTLVSGAGVPARDVRPAAIANLTVCEGAVVALAGDGGVEAAVIEQDGQRRSVTAASVFVYTHRVPQADFARSCVTLDPAGRIAVDQSLQSAAPGVFAAGDVRAGGWESCEQAMADGQAVASAILDRLRPA